LLGNKKHILLVIPDGIGIKNYIATNVLKNLNKDTQLTIYTNLNSTFIDDFQNHGILKQANYKNLKLFPESLLTRFFRETTTFARLKYNSKLTNNKTILLNWRKPKNNLKLYILLLFAQIMGYAVGLNYKLILIVETWCRNCWSKKIINYYTNELCDIGVTSIFITHQRIASIMPICIAARKLEIKVSTAIFSWDNLPKARLNVMADNYLVWSEHMINEMNNFYPHIENEHILLTGTPQFEHYFNERLKISRDNFAKRYNLPCDKTWICFSGDDELTSPNDPHYLNDLLRVVENKFSDELHIIFRRAPSDASNRFDVVLNEFNEICTEILPQWHFNQQHWSQNYPKPEDLELQCNLAWHCEAVVNLGSTMALDFSTHNKPCFYIFYNIKNNRARPVATIYNYQHFKTMHDLDAVVWITKPDQYEQSINKLLTQPEVLAKDKNKWFQKIARHPLTESSKLIAKAIE
jgi:hypothetical protein